MKTTLVLGATGYLGRFLVAELHARGHHVQAVVRDQARAETTGPFGAPALTGLVDQWVIGEVTDPEFAKDLAEGVGQIVSALGVTHQQADPWDVDYHAHLRILESALAHQVRSFAYVNVLNADRCPSGLTRAKSAFAHALAVSPIPSQIINPSAYFSDMAQMLALAHRGLVPVLEPRARINPIHGADLAAFTADKLESAQQGAWEVGGPETLTWRQIATTAFEVAGKRRRIVKIPSAVLTPGLRLTGLFNPRLADAARFATWNMLHDCLGQATGTHRLAEFFAENAPR